MRQSKLRKNLIEKENYTITKNHLLQEYKKFKERHENQIN